MRVQEALRLLAGVMVLLVVALAYFVSLYWLWLGVFVAINLIQSAFTKTCPAVWMFKSCGLKE